MNEASATMQTRVSVERPVTPLHASFLGLHLQYFELPATGFSSARLRTDYLRRSRSSLFNGGLAMAMVAAGPRLRHGGLLPFAPRMIAAVAPSAPVTPAS